MSLCQVNNNDENIMHVAVRAKQFGSAKCILELAVKHKVVTFFFNHKDKSGKTALELAYETKQQDIVELFESHLCHMAMEEEKKLDELLVQGDEDGNTPLHGAVFHNVETENAKTFLKIGKDFDNFGKLFNARNNHGLSVYDLAQLLEKKQFCDILLQPSDDKPRVVSNEAIQFYYEKIVIVNGNNILQEHVLRKNIDSIKKIKATAQKVPGLWQKMLANKNFDQKTAADMTQQEEIRSLLKA